MISLEIWVVLAMVAFVVLMYMFLHRAWVKAALVVFLYGAFVLTCTIGMSDIRSKIELARSQGKTKEFVSGLIERDKQLVQARIELFTLGTGLAIFGLAGVWGPLRFRQRDQKPEAQTKTRNRKVL